LWFKNDCFVSVDDDDEWPGPERVETEPGQFINAGPRCTAKAKNVRIYLINIFKNNIFCHLNKIYE
jgi:hypothetical protein